MLSNSNTHSRLLKIALLAVLGVATLPLGGCAWLPWWRRPPPAPPLPPAVQRTELETTPLRPAAPPPAPVEAPSPATAPAVALPPAEPPSPFAALFDEEPPASPATGPWIHQPHPLVREQALIRERVCTDMLSDTSRSVDERAALLAERARARLQAWQPAAALADLDAALALAPAAPETHLQRALTLGALDRAEEAAAPLQAAFHHAPESPRTAAVLGLLRFQQGRHRDAAEALGFFVESGVPDPTLRLLNATARLRAGLPVDLSDFGSARGRWPEPIAAFLARRIDRDTLRALARAVETEPPVNVACQMWFYFGQRALLQGDRAQATRDFLCALGTGGTAAMEYTLAVAELIQLGVIDAASLPGEVAP
jgi:tetratricopeptide (TPR) repeat protein